MLNHERSTLKDHKEIKKMYKQSAENLYRRDKRVTNAFEEESSEEASEILISDVKAALEILDINHQE